MTRMPYIQNLLNQSEVIVKKYRQIADISGENFNIFSILGLQSRETRLHSKLINELLNPKGKHGRKDLFLRLFIDVLNEKISGNLESEDNGVTCLQITDFKTEKASTDIEVYAGKINDEGTEGGRIDILINDNQGYGIIIENKIWASDQPNQLLRYHNYGNSNFKFHIVYLTIDGKIPSNYSTGGEKFDYLCISYKEDIIKWLELCRKECVQLPIIRETLTQYINQLKIYSGQSIHHMEREEIYKTILASEDNFESAKTIAVKFATLKADYMGKLKLQLSDLAKKVVQENSDYIYELQEKFYQGEQWKGGLILKKKNWFDKNMIIKFSFDDNNYNKLKYGFVRENESKNNGKVEGDFHNKLSDYSLTENGAKSDKFCPLYFQFEPCDWENNREVWLNIENGEMAKEFEKCLQRLLDIADKLEL